MTLKEILEKLKSKFEIIFKTNTKSLPILNNNRQVLIPTYIKDLNIDTNLNDEELKRYNQYKEEINLSNYDSILNYAEESFKRMNQLRDSILEHIEESAKIKREISKDKDYKKIITEEFESVFREYEAYDLFDDLNKIKRDTELRILAIQEKINEIEKSGRFKFWGARDKKSVQKSLIEVGNRIKINIVSGTLLANALNNELESNGFLRDSIENFIKENNNDEVKEIIEELLNNYYNQNVREYNAVSLLSKDIISKITPEYNLTEFQKLELSEQLKVIAQDRKKLRKYILDHKEELLPKLKEIKEDIDKKYYEIYDDYRNSPLWAKDGITLYRKFNKIIDTLLNYEVIYNFFQKDISEKDRENLYRALFYALYNRDDGLLNESNYDNIFLNKISYKVGKKYFCKFIDEIMERLVKTSSINVLNYMNKMIKNKSPQSILNNISSLSLISKLDRWGEYAYVDLAKDYSQFDDFIFSKYDNKTDAVFLHTELFNFHTEIAKRINQKSINRAYITDNNFPSDIYLNPDKYHFEPHNKIKLSDEIGDIARGLENYISQKLNSNELANRILELDELSFYSIPNKEYDFSEKYKVMFELKDGKPHFKLKIGYRHTNIISRNKLNGFLEEFRNNLRLGLIDFLSYRYYSKDELQNLKDSEITRKSETHYIGIETEDGGLLCHGADIYDSKQKELTPKFRERLHKCTVSNIFFPVSASKLYLDDYDEILFNFFSSDSPMYLYFTDPLTFNRLLIKYLDEDTKYLTFITRFPSTTMDLLFGIVEPDFHELNSKFLARMIERSNYHMDQYVEKRENYEREESK